MPTHDEIPTWDDYPDFVQNPVITALAGASRWTVSDKNKRPIDMQEFIMSGRNVLRGASAADATCLVTLPELQNALPHATNAAFFLRAQVDGIMIIDIEKTCPPHVRDELLRLPALYRERSMSGIGRHLVMPLPTNLHEFPDAIGKTKLQEEHGWWEILIEHYITFTRNTAGLTLEHPTGHNQTSWEDTYASLATSAVKTQSADILDVDVDRPDPLPDQDALLDKMLAMPYRKTLDDFRGDHSRYEFGLLGYLYGRLDTLLQTTQFTPFAASASSAHKAWMLYEAISQTIEHRPKHDELRRGTPLLLERASQIIALRDKERQQQQWDQARDD